MPDNLPLFEYHDFKPCRHIRRWVNALADDSLRGPARWFALWHIAYCRQCQAALAALKQVRAHLQTLREATPISLPTALSEERETVLRSALDEIERRRA